MSLRPRATHGETSAEAGDRLAHVLACGLKLRTTPASIGCGPYGEDQRLHVYSSPVSDGEHYKFYVDEDKYWMRSVPTRGAVPDVHAVEIPLQYVKEGNHMKNIMDYVYEEYAPSEMRSQVYTSYYKFMIDAKLVPRDDVTSVPPKPPFRSPPVNRPESVQGMPSVFAVELKMGPIVGTGMQLEVLAQAVDLTTDAYVIKREQRALTALCDIWYMKLNMVMDTLRYQVHTAGFGPTSHSRIMDHLLTRSDPPTPSELSAYSRVVASAISTSCPNLPLPKDVTDKLFEDITMEAFPPAVEDMGEIVTRGKDWNMGLKQELVTLRPVDFAFTPTTLRVNYGVFRGTL